ncbi:MAG: GumK N-terminal domain-containing glycosyltransferase [Methylophilus sp.]|uniref:GumK N-terminal domain-containing glycosyltransferase n=1 Tax=Methylophilus sp. TaxID=29541 RepID=UPI003F9EC999
MKVTLIVAHEYDAKRKVGFHYWADYLVENGHEVDYVSVGKSYLFPFFKRPLPEIKNTWLSISSKLSVYNWVSWVHPILNKPALNCILTPLFRLIPQQFGQSNYQRIAASDVVIVESGIGLAMIPFIKKLNKNVKVIYEASDRLKTVGAHPYVIEVEHAAKAWLDFIRVPAEVMLNDFKDVTRISVKYIPQGISKIAFDSNMLPNPYSASMNAISVGDMLFDEALVTSLAEAYPDWQFHLFGRYAKLKLQLPNVVEHGECKFDDIVPYMKHANIALAPYRNAPNCEYLSQSSLKILQYKYCNLPVVAPEFASSASPGFYSYNSIKTAINAFSSAINYEKKGLLAPIFTWDEVLDEMLNNINLKVTDQN